MTARPPTRPPKVLYVVEGFTDVRFVAGLSGVCDLTMVVPSAAYRSSGLDRRLAASGARLTVHEIAGGRLAYQVRSLAHLLRSVRRFDVVLAQEVTRGALSANLAGRLAGVPVVNTLAVPPVEYFRCRRERRLVGWWKHRLGDAVIRALMAANGRLAIGWLALGPYLRSIAERRAARVGAWRYYGVDTSYFCPAAPDERRELRRALSLPPAAFLILFASRISHEKDPETALRATHLARQRGLDAVLLNLGGGHEEFVDLARRSGLPGVARWALGRPAAHPATELADYFRSADLVVQSSLEEGLGLSPLESLACGTPVVATAVGGMAVQLAGHARLVPRGDPGAMAEQIVWVAHNRDHARSQAMAARQAMVVPEWDRGRTFRELGAVLRHVATHGALPPEAPEAGRRSRTRA